MAKVILSAGLEKLSGKMGNVVYRQLYGQTVAGAVPDFSGRKLTAAQKAHLQKVGASAKQASVLLKDPKKRAFYAALAKQERKPLVSVAIRDCYRKMP